MAEVGARVGHREQVAIEDEFIRSHPTSQQLHQAQMAVVPGGVTHSSRIFRPFPLFINSSRGSRKRDVDDHEYVDYWMGHGANLLGHGHPAVMEAISRQLSKGLHAGGENENSLRWAELICQMVPSAQKVRFCASGGEATQMAIRVARAFTRRDKIVKFEYHFHGWHDAVAFGVVPPFDRPFSAGIPDAIASDIVVVPFNELETIRTVLDNDDDIAGVILEPAGGYNSTIPVDPAFLIGLRELTASRGVVLIFDEVVSGFRYAPGGAQEFFGVIPDITALGKIAGGGLPVGIVAGSEKVMEVLAPRSEGGEARAYIPHFGTWNGAPITAAAGVATLQLIQDGELVEAARRNADELRTGLNDVFARRGVPGVAYGRSSIWKTYIGEPPRILSGDYSRVSEDSRLLRTAWGELAQTMRQSMILNGVDPMNTGGFMSTVHDGDDIERTVAAFDRTIERLNSARLLNSFMVRT
jgi:glutamate-1-semialdehyde 2,1-aminomutase